MSSDRVSDERLAELIAEESEEYAWAIAHPSMASADYPRDYKAALLELQSRRAAEQAALPAVEEMARKINNALLDKWHGDCSYDAQEVIAAALAPLFATLASQAELLVECREIVEARRDTVGTVNPNFGLLSRDAERELEELNALLTRIDALLGAKGGEDVE